MNRSQRLRRMLAATIAVGSLAMPARDADAAEDPARLLEGLRNRALYEEALDYLEQMRTSPQCPAEFRPLIDYEAGLTHAEAARVRAKPLRERHLEGARAGFEKFLAERPQHRLATEAVHRLAGVVAEQGRIKAQQAASATTPPEEKASLLADARSSYERAIKLLSTAEKHLLQALRQFPKVIDRADVKRIEARDRLRRDILQVRLSLPTVACEIANTYPAGSQEHKRRLTAAAEKYRELYEKYSTRLAGLYARMWQGRCYKDLGDHKRALACFDEIALLPDEPAPFRTLKTKSLVLALETRLLPAVKDYERAVAGARSWEESARGDEPSSAEGLAIEFLAGTAALELARALPGGDPQRAEYLDFARKRFTLVSRAPKRYRQQAEQMLTEVERLSEDQGAQPPALPRQTPSANAPRRSAKQDLSPTTGVYSGSRLSGRGATARAALAALTLEVYYRYLPIDLKPATEEDFPE